MANPFDQFDTPAEANPFDKFDAPAAKPAGALRKLGDLGLSAAKGVIAVPEAGIGLANLVTGGRAGKLAEDVGVRFKDAKDVLTGFQSDDLKAKQQAFSQADGVVDKFGVALSNPSLIANTVVESVPAMLVGGVAARGVLAAAPRLGAVGAGAVGEGLIGAGSAAEGIRQQTDDGLLSAKQTALAAGTGVATGAFGALGGMTARRLGIGDFDTMIAQGGRSVAGAAGQAPKGIVRRAAEGAFAEGVLEELPQSLSEQALQNAALDKPLTEGLADAGVMGVLAGGVMGAGAGALSRQTPAPIVPPPVDPVVNTTTAPLSLPPPAITVGSDGLAMTTEQRQSVRDNSGATDIETRTPSQAMGIDPSAGPLSAAAAQAVDTGLTQQVTQQAALEQAAAIADKAPAATKNVASETAVTSQNRPDALNMRNVDPDTGEIRSAYDVRQADAPRKEPGDIMSATGQAFVSGFEAAKAAKQAGPGHRPFKLAAKQFVVRKTGADLDSTSNAVPDVPATASGSGSTESGISLETGLGAGATAGPAVDAGRVRDQSSGANVPLANRTDDAAINGQNTPPPASTAQAQTPPVEAPKVGAPDPAGQAAAGAVPGAGAVQAAGVAAAKQNPADAKQRLSAEADEKPAGPQPGQIGAKYSQGDTPVTSSGRRTSPFPKVQTDTNRKAGNTVKAVDSWLMQNALDEANSRGDEFNARQFEARLKNPKTADKDSAEEYLFGESQPAVPRPFTRPLVPVVAAPGSVVAGAAPVSEPNQPVAQSQPAQTAINSVATPASVQPPPATTKNAKPKGLKQIAAQRIAQRADYFTPGNVVKSYGGHDEVVSYTPPDTTGGNWSVKVRAVVRKDGQWVPDPKDNRERLHTSAPSTKELDQGPVVRAEPAAAQKTETKLLPAQQIRGQGAIKNVADNRVGKDNTPLSEGGKPFKNKLQADAARKLQPMMRVVRVDGGFALADKTPAQLAAQEASSRRLRNANTSPAGEPIPAHAFIAAEGGLHVDTRADMNIGGNPRFGNRTLFAGANRAGLSMERATERLIEEGYLPEGASQNQAMALIKRSINNPQYTPEGVERMAEQEAEQRRKDYDAEQEALAKAQELEDNQLADLADAYEAAMLDYPQGVAQSDMDMADAMRAADFTEQEIENATTNRSQSETGTGQSPGGSDAPATGARTQGAGRRESPPGAVQGQDTGLTAPSQADILAQQDRAAAGEKTNASQRKAEQERLRRDAERKDIAKASEAAADTFELGGNAEQNLSGQGGMFDEPVAPANAPGAFIRAPDGSESFGEITPEMSKVMRRQAGKIKLRQGNDAWGLTHIQARHADQFAKMGYESVQAFVAKVAGQFNAIYQRTGSAFDVVLEDGDRGRLVVQLEPSSDGDFYDIKTASPIRDDQFKNKEPIWERTGTSTSAASQTRRPPSPESQNGTSSLAQPEAQGKQPSAAKPMDVPAPAAARYKILGKNADGQTLEEDANGVRSYVESGIRVREKVGLLQSASGIRRFVKHEEEFLTTQETEKLDGLEANANPLDVQQAMTGAVSTDNLSNAQVDQIAAMFDKKPAPAAKPDAPAVKPSANTVFTDEMAAAARARLKAKLGRLNSGIDPETMMDGITLAGYHMEKGARTFASFARAMVDDLGEAVKPYLKSWYSAIRYDPRATAFTNGMSSAAMVDEFDLNDVAPPADTSTVEQPTAKVEKAPVELVDPVDENNLDEPAGREGWKYLTYINGVNDVSYDVDIRDIRKNKGNSQQAIRQIRIYDDNRSSHMAVWEWRSNKMTDAIFDGLSINQATFYYSISDNTEEAFGRENVADGDALWAMYGREITNAVEKSNQKADTGVKDNGNATQQLDRPSTGTLAGASAEEVRTPEKERDAGEGSDRRSGGDSLGSANPDGSGGNVAGSLGADTGAVPVSAGRAGADAKNAKKPRVSRNGGVPPGSVPSGDARGGLTPDTGANPAPNAPQIAAPQPAAEDFTITDEFELGVGGQKTKFKNNIAAIKLVRDLESSGRMATPDEQKVLAKYVGWGGIAQAFDAKNADWAKEYAEITSLMSDDELDKARQSTRYAHYTSREIIVDGIYAAMRQFGFTGGRTLEAGAGVGNFIGLMPADMRSAGRFTAVEREPFSSAIARQLYPQQNVQRADFTEFKGTDAYFDAAVGNPPFASDPQTDRSGRKHLSGLSLHNYFFAKNIDMLREGGIMAQVVTNSFLDAVGDKARKYISDRAELLGAIRLPNNAFAKNAGTEVTTDIIFLKKRPDGEVGGKAARADAQRWLNIGSYTDKNGKKVALNQYFIDNPGMMLGDFGAFGTMYGPDNTALLAKPGQDTLALLKEAVGRLPAGVYKSITDTGTGSQIKAAVMALKNPSVKEGGYFVEGGKLIQRLPDIAGEARGVEITPETQWTEKTKLGEPGFERIKSLAAMRTTVRGLLAAEMSDNKLGMMTFRVALNKQYDQYRQTHGLLNDPGTLRVFDDDPDFPLLASLEHGYTPGIGLAAAKRLGVKPTASTAKKGPIFSQRVVAARQTVQKVETPADALAVSMAERGKLDAAYIGTLLGMEPEVVLKELSTGDKPLLFRDPATDEYVLRDAYLSGNVRAKLVQARQSGIFTNINALEAVQPEDVGSHEITARLGSPWVPTEVYKDFAQTLYGDNSRASVSYQLLNSSFQVSVTGASELAIKNTWGTPEFLGDELLQAIMNNRTIKVTEHDSEGKTYTNVDATERANTKAQEIKEKFNDWLFSDPERSELLTKAYNETNNNYVTRVYDGSNMNFPGKVPDSIIKFRRHQRNAIARIVQDRTALLDHVVGAGKTFTVISGAMELKRTGLARKPMVAVPNHLVKQWAADFYRLYPGANVLTATKKDFEKSNRRKFLARIATGDWDAVVIAHSSYGFIKPSPEFEIEFNQREIRKIMATIQSVEADDSDKQAKRRTVKQLEGMKERFENRIKALRDKPMDDLLDFEQIGVDQLFIDEAHCFKNLLYTTKMQGVAGLNDPTGSQRAYDMYIKTNQVMEKNGRGQGVVFATGTPVSNSLAEMYHMMRYLMPAQMKELGFESFDAWANTYASVEQVWMQAPSGDGFKAQNRMSNFVNTPELLKMFDQVSDTVTMDDIKKAYSEENNGDEFPLPKLKGGRRTPVSLEKSAAQNAYMDTIAERAKRIEKRKGPPEKGDDNIMVVMSDARKAAMDIRLVDPSVTKRETGGRIDLSTDQVVGRYKQFDAVKGTQLVFSDMGTPLKNARKELTEYKALQARIEAGNEDVATSATLGNEAAIGIMEDAEAAQAELDAMGLDWLSAVKSAMRGFSVYDDFKAALIEKGVPEAEIAFIHDANTDDQKAALFRKVNAGQIRVLLGSTAKMGAGTNVQERLVALHHLDVPWRPSDVEQREGRIERQGNLFATQPTKDKENPHHIPGFEIEILAYVTRDTLDMRMWQVQETKLKMINQLRTRKIGREIDNAFEDMELSAGEMQAAATGDVNLLKEIQLRNDVKKLEQRRRSFDGQRYDLIARKRRNAEQLRDLPKRVRAAEIEATFAEQYKSDLYAKAPPFKMNIDGKDYSNAKEAQEYLRAKDEATEERTDLAGEVTLKKAPLSVTIDGELIKNRNTMGELLSNALGDAVPIMWEMNGETYRRRTVLANAMRQNILNALADENVQQVGTIGAYSVAVEGSSDKSGSGLLEVTMRRDGDVKMSNQITVGESSAAPARVIGLAENLMQSAINEADYLERALSRAQKDAAELDKAPVAGDWPDQPKLDAARTAHKDVLAVLKKKEDSAAQNPASEDVNFGAPSNRTGTPTDRAVMGMVREGKSAQDVLRLIAGTSRSRFNKQVARLLLKTNANPAIEMGGDLGSGAGFKFLAKYSPTANVLTMTDGAQGQAEQIFMHEMVHAATMQALNRKGLASVQMRRLFDHVQKQGGAAGQYGMKNVREFVSEAFTNPEFQSALKAMSAPSGGSLRTAWDSLVRIIKGILGLPDDSTNALSAALDIGVAVMREDMRLRQRGAVAKGEDANFGEAIKAVTVTDIKTKAGNKLADYRNLGLQFLGGRQINDLYVKDLPQLNSYTTMVQQMSADANEVGANADAVATSWGKLADERQLAELMHDATLAQIDPAKPYVQGDNRLQWGALNAKFKALTPDAQKVYTDARDGYEEHYAQIREAIRDKIGRSEMNSEAKAALLARMDGEFFEKIKGVYFPLARFGKYVVVTRKGPDVVSVSRAETLNEAESLRTSMRKQFPADQGYAVGKVLKDKEFNAARDSVGRGFLKDLFGVLDKEGVGEQLQDAVNQLYLASMPDLSWAKHGIHRKGTPGFSQDARRAYAQNMFHGARYLAKLRYADQLQAKLADMQEHVDAQVGNDAFDSVKGQQLVDELNKRNDSLMNPNSNPLSTALTSFGFIFHLGLSPASAMVNLSQTALVAYPIMGAKWGFDKAAAALAVAGKQAAANKNDISSALNADERRAYDAAVNAGTIDVTNANDLAGIAQGEDQGVMWKMRPVMKWASFLFHHAERFNRQVTFVASYRLARAAGTAHDAAFEQATKATYDGHFDYAASNRARVMQGNTAKVVLLFKQYAQNMIYTLMRQAQLSINAETPESRKEARKALGGLLVLHASAAGVLGLPMVTTLLAAASMLGGSDDEPWDAETALRNLLADTFGQKPAEVMARGFSRLTPFDISGRVGLDKLIFPDLQEGLEGQRLGEAAMAAALGPVAGIGINMLKGMQEISEGRTARGLESMMPAALRGPIKAVRYESEGVKDKTGIVIQDEVSTAGVLGQAMGFSPSEVRNATEGRGAIFQADRRLTERRQELTGQYAKAHIEKDAQAIAQARAGIDKFNQANPSRRINGLQLMQSVRGRQKRIDQAENGVYLPKNRQDAREAGRFAEVE